VRTWFGHDPAKWTELKQRYWKELDKKKDSISKLAEKSRSEKVTFVFASKEEKYNNAVALKEYIESRF